MNQIRLEEAQVAAAANALLLAEPIELGQACLRLGGPLAFEVTPREHPCSSSACSPPMNRRSAESSLHALGRVLSPGGSSEGGKLDVRLIPRLAPMAQSDEEKESDRQMLEVCRALLAEEPSTVRASACQKLGQLGLPEAEEPLSRLLESDTEPALVREAARQALVDLETPRVSREALGGLRLRLTPEDKDTEPMEAITDRRGRAVFENVPGEGRARLAVVERLGQDWLLEVRWSQRGQPHIDVFMVLLLF